MARLADLVTRRARLITIAALLAVVMAGVVSSGVDPLLSTGGNEVPGSGSALAGRLLDERGEGAPNLVVLVTEDGGLGRTAAAVADDVTDRLSGDTDITVVASAFPAGSARAADDAAGDGRVAQGAAGDGRVAQGAAGDGRVARDAADPRSPYVSDDGTQGLILATIGGTDAEVQRRAAEINESLRTLTMPPGVDLLVGGSGPSRADLIETTDRGLVRAELIALPISLLILLWVFRTPVAAALPLVVAAVAIVGTLAVLRLLVTFVEVSVFARSVATAIGLAMAVDTSLFLFARYREMRPAAPDPTEAVRRAVIAAGPAVLFSGLTTGAALGGLLAFSTPLLRSFAYAGATVVLAALIGALVVLPATMTVLGDRVDARPIRPIRPPAPTRPPGPTIDDHSDASSPAAPAMQTTSAMQATSTSAASSPAAPATSATDAASAATAERAGSVGAGVAVADGRWHRVAMAVSRRPVLLGLATLAVLATLVSPIGGLRFGLNDDRVLPADVESRVVNDAVRTRFSAAEGGAISVVYLQPPTGDADGAEVEQHRAALAKVPGVARVDRRPTSLAVIPSVEPMSPEGRALVERIRAVPSPLPSVVGGEAARLVDNTDHVVGRLPVVVAAMVAVSVLLLGILFRSVLLPIKAVVLNLLSLSAMFGAVVWVFQDGRFSGLLGYTPTGLTDVTVPMLMFAIAFGLAMDYEVYLLSRIREEYRAGASTVEATARGLQRTGGILSASAVLMAVVFMAFTTAGVTHLKVLGLGISLAVLLDAFVVPALLVPSVMTVAGAANWWPGNRRS